MLQISRKYEKKLEESEEKDGCAQKNPHKSR